MGRSLFQTVAMIPGIIIAMSLHEFAHAFVANKMGDDTAERMGRLTLNPMSHIDPVGFLMLLIGGFGWARPVPYNEINFRNRHVGVFLTAIAGVVMNILIAVLAIIIYELTGAFFPSDEYFAVMQNIAWINIAFASFNLLPIPPLDGSKLIAALLPTEKRYWFYQYERYGFFLMIFLIMTNMIDYLLDPIVGYVISTIDFLVGIVL